MVSVNTSCHPATQKAFLASLSGGYCRVLWFHIYKYILAVFALIIYLDSLVGFFSLFEMLFNVNCIHFLLFAI